jgi:hypothetical protein
MGGQFVEHGGIVIGFDDHGHVGVVLGRGTDHRRPTDVDVFDAVVVIRAPGDGRLEWIKIHHQEIDRLDVVRLHRGGVFLVGADRQQPAMHTGMQSLDAAVHHLGKTGKIGNVGNIQPRILQCLGGATGGNEVDAEPGQLPGEIDKPGLVGNRQQSAGDTAGVAGHPPLMSLAAFARKGKGGEITAAIPVRRHDPAWRRG